MKWISEEDMTKDKKAATKNKIKFKNLELILKLEEDYPGIFIKAMTNFNMAKEYRKSLSEEGKKIIVPWEEALKKLYLGIKYNGVSKENDDIAKLFEKKGLPQTIYDEATRLRREAVKFDVPEHILGKPLKEKTILESIEEIKEKTGKELIYGKEMIEEQFSKQFTYEWLSKNDPNNGILGLLCDCCGSITSKYFGSEVSRRGIISSDVQNLVIRDVKGDIISKGTIYINKKNGYGVINSFQLNEQYRNHEVAEEEGGRYRVEVDSKEEQDRNMIFKAFQRGLEAFIEEYDRQNPNNPLTQVNIGMGHNKLKRQVENFKKATENLTIPFEYHFEDAEKEQYILYKREQRQIEEGRI